MKVAIIIIGSSKKYKDDDTFNFVYSNDFMYGIEKALKVNPDYICKIENTELDCNILKTILTWFERGCKSFVVAPSNQYKFDKIVEMNERGLKASLSRTIDTSFIVAPTYVIKKLIYAPQPYLTNDILLCKRFWEIGYPTVYIDELKIEV